MRTTSSLFKKLSKSFLFIFVIYSFFWYGVGQYIKNKIEPVVSQSLNLSSASYDQIDLGGYPFSF